MSHIFTLWLGCCPGACCRPLRDGAAGPALIRHSHQRLGQPGLHSLRAGAHGEDLQPAAAAPPAGESEGDDEKVKTSLPPTPR